MDNIRSVAASRCYSTVRSCLVEHLNNSRYTCETGENYGNVEKKVWKANDTRKRQNFTKIRTILDKNDERIDVIYVY